MVWSRRSGLKHYKYNPKYNDTELARRKLNRVTDTLEPETNLDTVEEVIGKVIEKIDGKRAAQPDRAEQTDRQTSRGKLSERSRHSEIGLSPRRAGVRAGFRRLGVGQRHLHSQHQTAAARQETDPDGSGARQQGIDPRWSPASKRFGIFSIGGGVPRNNVQNVAPLIEIINERLGPTFPNRRFSYGVRICPDKPHFGHLSGCTYSENESWRKADKNGIYAEMLADATQVWPFLVKYIMEKRDSGSAR